MHTKQFWYTCLVSVVLIVTLCVAGHSAALRTTLPLEVLGAESTTKTALVLLPHQAATLTMTVHGLENEQEGSVKVGLGPWHPLTNNAVLVADPGKSYGGIGGGFSTLTITLPLTRIEGRPGLTSVQFRFNHTDGVNFGYRVLGFNFIDSRGMAMLPASMFVQHDPATETAVLTRAADIAAGKTLWHTARLVEEPEGKFVLATCASCHSEDGRDLKYYGYTNNTITQRCAFHGLTPLQAEQLTSYIRTLPVAVQGRPWNPPYQPGPGLDSKPVVQWAAGAGLEAVLACDTDMLPYLFGHGITKVGIGTGDTLNLRELPVALQLPDWNHWLPRIHPKDAFGDDFTGSTFASFYDGAGPNQDPHGNMRGILDNPDPNYHTWFTASPDAPLYHFMGYWSEALQGAFMLQEQQKNDGAAAYQEALQSAALWRLVKDWELMQEYSLEANAPQIFPTTPGAPNAGESRSWVSESAFLASPAFAGVEENGSLYSRVLYEYRTNVWYYLGAVLNSGNRHRQGQHPVDWGYAVGRTGDLSRVSGQGSTLRMTALLIKGMQQCDTDGALDTTSGWFPKFAGDVRFYFWAYDYRSLPKDVYAQVATAVAGAQFDKMQQYSSSQWQASQQWQPVVLYGGDPLESMQQQTLTDLSAIGVDKSLLDAEADWDATVWPDGGFAALRP